jgi:hypothetical protein
MRLLKCAKNPLLRANSATSEEFKRSTSTLPRAQRRRISGGSWWKRISLGVLPVQRLNALANAPVSW